MKANLFVLLMTSAESTLHNFFMMDFLFWIGKVRKIKFILFPKNVLPPFCLKEKLILIKKINIL